jgi:predicted Zn-dependent protease
MFAPAAVTLSAILLFSSGCASLAAWKPTGDDVSERAAARKVDTLANLERRRDAATLQAAADHLARGDRNHARQILEQLLARDGKSSAARLLLARVHLEGDDAEAAEEQLRAGLATDPNHAALHYELGLLLDSREHLTRASELEPRNELYQLAARTGKPQSNPPSPPRAEGKPASQAAQLLQQGKPNEALKTLQAALEREPDSAVLHRLAGAAHLARREPDLAADALRQSLALDNSCGLSYLLLGHALSQSGEQQAAEAAFQEAARRDARLARGKASPPS